MTSNTFVGFLENTVNMIHAKTFHFPLGATEHFSFFQLHIYEFDSLSFVYMIQFFGIDDDFTSL